VQTCREVGRIPEGTRKLGGPASHNVKSKGRTDNGERAMGPSCAEIGAREEADALGKRSNSGGETLTSARVSCSFSESRVQLFRLTDTRGKGATPHFLRGTGQISCEDRAIGFCWVTKVKEGSIDRPPYLPTPSWSTAGFRKEDLVIKRFM